jgi:hypothetical protein
MHKLNLRGATRRTLLILWLPSTLLVLPVAAYLLASSGPSSTILPFTAGNPSGSLFAAAPPQGSVLGDSVVANSDARSRLIQSFLINHGSPLANHAGTFVTVADKYNLDWRLLPAIAGAESNFGRSIPRGSFNAWGWGIPTGASSGIGFDSWDDGIETVGRGLRNGYLNKGYNTLMEIESRYTPPSASQKSHPWVTHVSAFMYELEHTK